MAGRTIWQRLVLLPSILNFFGESKMRFCFSLLAALLLTVAVGCNEPATNTAKPAAESAPATENTDADGNTETAAESGDEAAKLVDVTLNLPGVS
jgi:hypothetical protein